MATDPVDMTDDLASVVARVRRQAAEAGELVAPDGAAYEPDLDDADREFILSIVRDGSYAAAVAQLANHDPDLAIQ